MDERLYTLEIEHFHDLQEKHKQQALAALESGQVIFFLFILLSQIKRAIHPV
ncbi:hypothetical protein Loa_01038 [Legionella oakridgensis ATCC 33761 = DSM 21215]|uniref:Uncharacterized protein n=1 Tax=Legionella oakridgensis ATCC 33761 = DSM 21215 TaxID=1268635 RepID=W0BDU6_9GAMM|nr:hypothetical protein [Legionella oakridgensis]AHE66594.1 hypothetical protein Loa_01038 [Legionella oakridgensis ATCC 33761 = DSM 21215]